MSIGDKLRELNDLRAQGILTDEEFEAQKKRVLDASSAAPAPVQYEPDYDEPCPPTKLAEAVLVTLFCCLPFGIMAIIKASSVSQVYNQYGYTAALEASAEAGKWVNYSIFAGLGFSVLYFLALMGGAL